MEDNGFTQNTDMDDDSEVMFCAPGDLHKHLLKMLKGKSRHAHIAQCADGLIFLVETERRYFEYDNGIPLRYAEIVDFLDAIDTKEKDTLNINR